MISTPSEDPVPPLSPGSWFCEADRRGRGVGGLGRVARVQHHPLDRLCSERPQGPFRGPGLRSVGFSGSVCQYLMLALIVVVDAVPMI